MSDVTERAILGAILMDPVNVEYAYERIIPDMFENPFYQEAYKEILKDYDTGKDVTLIGIAQKLQSESFTQEYIMQELREVVLKAEGYKIRGYVDALIAEYKTRRLKNLLSKTVPAIPCIDEQISNLLQELEAMRVSDTVKIHALSEIVDEVSKGYFTEPDIEPLYVGLERLDNALGGLEGGDVIVIGARPAVGKSAFVTQIGLHLSRGKKKVAFYNLEMSDKQIYERLLSGISGIGLTRIRRAHNFLGDEREHFNKANEE